jgi:prepilin-type N-terminal cleavage/methylation domain-containing protein
MSNLSRTSGFTLIELMIVTAIISVVAGVAVPNLLSSRSVANERVVLAALRTITTAQVQCQSRALVDVDGDGQGEALGLAEMAGARTLRGSTTPLMPPVLPQSLGQANATGSTLTRGYLMAIYLPDATGTGLPSIPSNDASIAPDQAELAWTCVAWPMTRGRTGRSTFFVNQTGEILESKLAAYDGAVTVPPPGAALLGGAPAMIVGLPIAANTVGADGNFWSLIR